MIRNGRQAYRPGPAMNAAGSRSLHNRSLDVKKLALIRHERLSTPVAASNSDCPSNSCKPSIRRQSLQRVSAASNANVHRGRASVCRPSRLTGDGRPFRDSGSPSRHPECVNRISISRRGHQSETSTPSSRIRRTAVVACRVGHVTSAAIDFGRRVRRTPLPRCPVVEALLYSVARFSKKLACSTAFSISSSQGSGFRATWYSAFRPSCIRRRSAM